MQPYKMAWRRSKLVFTLLVVFLLSAAGVGNDRPDLPDTHMRTVLETASIVKTQYVDEIDMLDLIGAYIATGDIAGMLERTLGDPYSYYIEREAYDQMQINIEGVFGGIGIMVGIQNDALTVVAPIDNTPGHRAGLRGGDKIVAVDDKSTKSMSLNEAVSYMRGPKGTPVRLGIERDVQDTTEYFEVDIVRDIIEVDSVSNTLVLEPSDDFPMLRDRIGYVRVSNFSARTDVELRQALLQIVGEENASGLVLDLRDNPGGVFGASVDVSNLFIDNGPIVHVVGRNDNIRSFHARPQLAMRDLPPVVVLVNGYSASASEIVAGALQDRERAVLVGETTFGKGLVQTIFPLREGALSLTTDRYQTAGGRFIHEEGIVPDVIVEWPVEMWEEARFPEELNGLSPDDPQLAEALRLVQEAIDRAALLAAG